MVQMMTTAQDYQAQREADRLREAELLTVPSVQVKIPDVDSCVEWGLLAEESKRDPVALAEFVAGRFAGAVYDMKREREKAARQNADAQAGAMTIPVTAHMIRALRQTGFLWGAAPYAASNVLEALSRALGKGFTLLQLESLEDDGSRAQPGVLRQIPVSTAFQPSGQTGRGASDLSFGPRR
jgi:hypothetical protein